MQYLCEYDIEPEIYLAKKAIGGGIEVREEWGIFLGGGGVKWPDIIPTEEFEQSGYITIQKVDQLVSKKICSCKSNSVWLVDVLNQT